MHEDYVLLSIKINSSKSYDFIARSNGIFSLPDYVPTFSPGKYNPPSYPVPKNIQEVKPGIFNKN